MPVPSAAFPMPQNEPILSYAPGTPERAALKCAALMKASFAAGGGGVKLSGGDPAFRPHVVNH